MRKLLLLSTAIAFAMSAPAMADTFQADSFSQPNGFQDVTVTHPVSETVRAGEIDLHNNATNSDLLVWCLDLQDLLFTPYTFQEHTLTAGLSLPGLPAGGLNAAQDRQIASLMLRGLTLGGADAADDDAATQLAIWTVEYGTNFAANIGGALLTRTNLELADSMAGGSLDCPTCAITVLSDAVNAPNQALGFAAPVPGPVIGAGLPGLIAGAFGLWGLQRRRRSAV